MKDIELNTLFKKSIYYTSWTLIICGFNIFLWLLIVGLATYGKTTSLNVEKKKWVLNKTYQKFVFVVGSINIFIIVALIVIILSS